MKIEGGSTRRKLKRVLFYITIICFLITFYFIIETALGLTKYHYFATNENIINITSNSDVDIESIKQKVREYVSRLINIESYLIVQLPYVFFVFILMSIINIIYTCKLFKRIMFVDKKYLQGKHFNKIKSFGYRLNTAIGSGMSGICLVHMILIKYSLGYIVPDVDLNNSFNRIKIELSSQDSLNVLKINDLVLPHELLSAGFTEYCIFFILFSVIITFNNIILYYLLHFQKENLFSDQ
ncbi:MAG: hypothetical protein COA79_17590 [Planctomycetota bacterium]|nr:MAG: hypothetical protein COA79_17590 [Planctomycetota bacterium]